MPAAEASNVHASSTLRHETGRIGNEIAIDRNMRDQDGVLLHWSLQEFGLQGDLPDGPARVSLKGHFIGPSLIQVDAYYVHVDGLRDWFSYLGLLSFALWWIVGLMRGMRV